MGMFLWAVAAVLLLIIIVLMFKIISIKRAIRDIDDQLREKLDTDTNVLLDVGINDRDVRHLAAGLNIQLEKLKSERHRFRQGDMELKAAVTNISHDIRTPLTAISGYIGLMKKEELSRSALRYVKIIEERSEMMKKLTDELFGYSCIAADSRIPVIEETAVNQALEDSIAGFYWQLRKRQIEPEVDITEKKVVWDVDKDMLSRIFSNILDNAVKYSDGDLRISLSEDGEAVFSNHTSSMSEINAGKLFNRFYTVQEARASTGLGLSIAKTLTEEMKGTIAAAYKDGEFMISLKFPCELSKNM